MTQLCQLNHEHKHGATSTCYTGGKCRCEDCKRARTEYAYWRRNAGRTRTIVDGTGTRRRLQALCAIGWTFIEIGRRYGMTRQGVRELAYAETVRDDTAERVRRIYDDLSMRVPEPRSGYERGSAIKARNHAARMGWPPPLAWDDEDLDRPDARPAQRKDAA